MAAPAMIAFIIANMNSPEKKPIQFTLRSAFAGISLVAVLTFGCTLFSRHVQDLNLDPTTANQRLEYIQSPIRIPQNAWECSFIGGFYRTSCATFRVRESEFKKFAANLGLTLKEANPIGQAEEANDDYCFRLIGGHTVNRTSRGLVASTMSSRGGWKIVFDAANERAFVIHSHR